MKTFCCCEFDMNGLCIPNTGCGSLDFVLFNGSSVSRVLEGVMFRLNKDETVAAEDDWDTNRYLRGLNKTYWLEKSVSFTNINDVFQCPKCGDSV